MSLSFTCTPCYCSRPALWVQTYHMGKEPLSLPLGRGKSKLRGKRILAMWASNCPVLCLSSQCSSLDYLRRSSSRCILYAMCCPEVGINSTKWQRGGWSLEECSWVPVIQGKGAHPGELTSIPYQYQQAQPIWALAQAALANSQGAKTLKNKGESNRWR